MTQRNMKQCKAVHILIQKKKQTKKQKTFDNVKGEGREGGEGGGAANFMSYVSLHGTWLIVKK